MPKRKYSDSDLSSITKKLRKIEKQLKRSKSRKKRLISSSSKESIQAPEENNVTGNWDSNTTQVHDENIDSILLNTLTDDVITTVPPPPHGGEVENTVTEIVEDAGIEKIEDNLDGDLLDILGDDPTTTIEFSKDVRPEIANRFEHISTCGLNKDIRKELCEKYLLPGNCAKIGAPALNPEVKAAVSDVVAKRDKFMEARQKKIGSVISCLASAISMELEAKEKNSNLLKQLMDAGRLLCDVQHDESLVRRNFTISSLKTDMKDSLYNTKIDKFLFGETLAESLKAAKAVTKSGTELKGTNYKNTNPRTKINNLNWRAPVAARRQPPTPRSRAPAVAATAAAMPYPYPYPPHPYLTPAPPPPPPPPPRAPRATLSSRPPPPPPPPQRSTRRR